MAQQLIGRASMKLLNAIVNGMAGFTLGLCFSGWFYCKQLGIVSGPMYIEPLVMVIAVLSIIGLKAIMYFDPTFKGE